MEEAVATSAETGVSVESGEDLVHQLLRRDMLLRHQQTLP